MYTLEQPILPPNGNRGRITHPDETQFNYAYDGLNRPTTLTDTAQALTHTYEPWGSVNGIVRNGGASGRWQLADRRLISMSHYDGPSFTVDTYWAFTHNPAGQIASQWGLSDAYAWTGHYAVQRPYTTNGLNQYSAAGSATFTYDANGNLTADGTNTYSYDIENRFRAFTRAHPAPPLPAKAIFSTAKMASAAPNRLRKLIAVTQKSFGPSVWT